LRLEAGFQLGAGDAPPPGTTSLLGDAYDDAADAAPEAPFCVATFPLRLDEPSRRSCGNT